VQEQYDQLTSPFSSDDYKNFEQGKTNAALLTKFVLSTKLYFFSDFFQFKGILYKL
jgi:hypothetical protein